MRRKYIRLCSKKQFFGTYRIFKLPLTKINRFEMKIFNRWGEQLYGSSDISNGWDGTYKGNDMPEGTYAFVADITDFAGRDFTRSGSVVLLRKK